jgi:transcriptional regulator with XRE-family HTH domain
MDILAKIKKLQNARGWSEARLAEEAGLTPSTISSLYKRNNLPTIPTLQALCSAFGISVARFFSDGDAPPQGLSKDRAALLEHWDTLTDAQKEALLHLIKTM